MKKFILLLLLLISPIVKADKVYYQLCVPQSPADPRGCPIKTVQVPRFNQPGILTNVWLYFGFSCDETVKSGNNNDYTVSVNQQLTFNTRLYSTIVKFDEKFTSVLGEQVFSIKSGEVVTNIINMTLAPSSPVTYMLTSDLDQWQGIGFVDFTVVPTCKIGIECQGNIVVEFSVHTYSYIGIVYEYVKTSDTGAYPVEYWTKYNLQWPTQSLYIAGNMYNASFLLKTLNDKTVNFSLSVLKELIAAKFNTFPTLCNNTTCVVQDILNADAYLMTHPVFTSGQTDNNNISILQRLRDYNQGKRCELPGAFK
jgi:hypothetical protein